METISTTFSFHLLSFLSFPFLSFPFLNTISFFTYDASSHVRADASKSNRLMCTPSDARQHHGACLLIPNVQCPDQKSIAVIAKSTVSGMLPGNSRFTMSIAGIVVSAIIGPHTGKNINIIITSHYPSPRHRPYFSSFSPLPFKHASMRPPL